LRRALLSWSSGKDSAWALHLLRQRDDIEVLGLLTTISRPHARVAMHAVRESLLEAQAAAAGVPVRKVFIPSPCPNEEYERVMAEAMDQAKADGIDTIAFGDLYLEDIRRYREEKLASTGLSLEFPLWGMPTGELANHMVASGLEAYVTCVDPRVLDRSFAGRRFDRELLEDLPEGVDPCGENGEFHTYAIAGPMFRERLAVAPGEVVERDGFVFADLDFLPDRR
jgi:uncharacterized protein (TIGR00290 family)